LIDPASASAELPGFVFYQPILYERTKHLPLAFLLVALLNDLEGAGIIRTSNAFFELNPSGKRVIPDGMLTHLSATWERNHIVLADA